MIGSATYNVFVEQAKYAIVIAKSSLIRGRKIAAGTLYKSLDYDVNKKTGQTQFFYAPEGEFVESGRKKGARFPPPGAISKWASIKGIPRFRDKKGRYISNDSRTFLLSRSIVKKGIMPFPFYTDAIKKAELEFTNDLEDAIVEDMENTIDQSLAGSLSTHMNF